MTLDPTADLFVGEIVDRQHVGDSHLSVIRAVRAALTPKARHSPEYRAFRRACYRLAVRLHNENRALYRRTRGAI